MGYSVSSLHYLVSRKNLTARQDIRFLSRCGQIRPYHIANGDILMKSHCRLIRGYQLSIASHVQYFPLCVDTIIAHVLFELHQNYSSQDSKLVHRRLHCILSTISLWHSRCTRLTWYRYISHQPSRLQDRNSYSKFQLGPSPVSYPLPPATFPIASNHTFKSLSDLRSVASPNAVRSWLWSRCSQSFSCGVVGAGRLEKDLKVGR